MVLRQLAFWTPHLWSSARERGKTSRRLRWRLLSAGTYQHYQTCHVLTMCSLGCIVNMFLGPWRISWSEDTVVPSLCSVFSVWLACASSHIPFTSTYNAMLHSNKGSAQTPDVYFELIAHFQSSCSDLQLMIKTTCFGKSHKLYFKKWAAKFPGRFGLVLESII